MSRHMGELYSQERRMFLIKITRLLGLTMIVSRLCYFQIFQNKKYSTLSDGNRIRILIDPAERGKILDRHEHVLAEDKYYETIAMTPRSVSNFNDTIAAIVKILDLSLEEQERIIRQRRKKTIVFKDEVSWQKLAEITHSIPDMQGISMVAIRRRFYPFGKAFAHAIGYTQASPANLPILNNGRIDVGAAGFERSRNAILSGRAGYLKVEVNAHGDLVREVERNHGENGGDTIVTLDANYQRYATKLLENISGAIIVIDLVDGSVITLCSAPSYDPNAIISGISHDNWNHLSSQDQAPMFNRALSRLMPPASTYKLVIALSALSKRTVNESTIYDCEGVTHIGDRDFHCMRAHREQSLQSAIATSCNTFFYNLAKQLDVDYTATIAHKLGLGVPQDMELPMDSTGLVPTAAWKQKKYKSKWQYGDTINYVIGQGYVLCTPMQLAIMGARLATRTKIVPTFSQPKSKVHFDKLDIDERALNIVCDAMIKTMNMPYGTGYYASISNGINSMAGKTGTSQIVSVRNNEPENSLFVGFAPYDKPRYAISAITERFTSRDNKAAFLSAAMMRFILSNTNDS